MAKSPNAYRNITEVAKWLNTQAHVLRYWETRFNVIKPKKFAGGRRHYDVVAMRILGGIKRLLHQEGMSIREVQHLMHDHGADHIASFSPPLEHETISKPVQSISDSELPMDISSHGQAQIIPFTINPASTTTSKPPPQQPLLFPEIAEWTQEDNQQGSSSADIVKIKVQAEIKNVDVGQPDASVNEFPSYTRCLSQIYALPRAQRRNLAHTLAERIAPVAKIASAWKK